MLVISLAIYFCINSLLLELGLENNMNMRVDKKGILKARVMLLSTVLFGVIIYVIIFSWMIIRSCWPSKRYP